MRTPRPALLLLLCVLIPASLSAQQSTPTPPAQRDPQAVAAVQAAIAAFGSSAVAQSLQAQGQVDTFDPGGNATNTITWEMAGSEFRVESSSGASSGVVVTGHGNPTVTIDGQTQPVPKYVIQAMFIPAFAGAILAREFQNPNYSLQYIGAQTLNDTPVAVVETALPTAPNAPLTSQLWYFSNATNLPIRVTYRAPADQTPLRSWPETVDLSNFTSVSGGMYPFKIVVSDERPLASILLQSVNPSANIPSTNFDAPTGGTQ